MARKTAATSLADRTAAAAGETVADPAPPAPKGRPRSTDAAMAREAAALYARGASLRAVAERLGVGFGTAQRLIASVGAARPRTDRPSRLAIPADAATLRALAARFEDAGRVRVRAHRHRAKPTMTWSLAIACEDAAALARLRGEVGGGAHRDGTTWVLTRSSEVQSLLAALLPYLSTRRREVGALLAEFAPPPDRAATRPHRADAR